MIRINRTATPPPTLDSQICTDAKLDISKHARNGKSLSKLFKTLWGNADVREALWLMQQKKCAYCERKRDKNRESDVEHFRPKAEVTESPSHSGYWWLAYEWSNLLFSCRHCNQEYKKNRFPVPNEQTRAKTESDDLSVENSFLLDPSLDDPENHFSYDWVRVPFVMIAPRNNSDRARHTIDILQLNRQDLLEERTQIREDLLLMARGMHQAIAMCDRDAIAEVEAKIMGATHSSQPFAGFRRDYFARHGLEKYVNPD